MKSHMIKTRINHIVEDLPLLILVLFNYHSVNITLFSSDVLYFAEFERQMLSVSLHHVTLLETVYS